MGNIEDRQLRTLKTFNVPVALLWEVWTRPQHLINWWGPKGFTTTIHQMELVEEGEWKLTLHSPDGTNYANRSIFKKIIPNQKIVFEHFNPHFTTTVVFESKGEQSQIDWTMVFDTVEMYQIVVKMHKADKGQEENIERLENYLTKLRRL